MLKIGNLELKNNLILAPMLGVNCNVFRLLCKQYGAGLVYTPMIHPDSLKYQKDKIDIIKEEKPIAAQIVGKDPKELSQAAITLEDHADIIDINLGCPDKEILAKKAGAFLIKHPEQFVKPISKVISSVNCPITAKIRIGWDDTCINAVEVAKSLEDLGINAITVHGRTRKQVYSGKARWDIIKQVKDKVNIPIIGNGDVFSHLDYNNMLNKTNVDFVMIGRGAIGNPLIFHNCLNQDNIIKKDNKTAKNLFDEFYDLYQKHSPRDSFTEIRQHAMWFVKGIKGAARIKDNLMKCNNIDKVKQIIDNI